MLDKLEPDSQFSRSNRLRLFAAVAIEGEARDKLVHAVAALKPMLHGARWVAPYNLHLTLKFFGAVDPGRLPDLNAAMAEAAAAGNRCELRLDHWAALPRWAQATVIVASGQVTAGLARLHGIVESACAKAGFEPEVRGFRPHITLARYMERTRANRPPDSSRPDVLVGIDAITLFRSEAAQRGSLYTPMGRWALAG
jgi:2'-5' RNA ligase